MMAKHEERIREKLEEPTKRVGVFEAKNRIHFINQNVMSVVRFFSGPVEFTLGWLERIDRTIRQHMTRQGMLMKRWLTTARLYMKPEDKALGLKSRVGVYLLELIRVLIQYKWGTIFRQEWFWRIDEFTKRNGKGVWLRETEKVLKMYDASLEWLLERIGMRDEEMNDIKQNVDMDEMDKTQKLKAMKMKSIVDVMEEVEVLIDTHFFNEFFDIKSSLFLKKIIADKSSIEVTLLEWELRTLNCSTKTMKVVREI